MKRAAVARIFLIGVFPIGVAQTAAADAPQTQTQKDYIIVDCGKSMGGIRALNGVNNGPLDGGGLVDLSEPLKALDIPLVRLHDVHWPTPDAVDMHLVFPDPNADPAKPESYDFLRTDEYLAAIVKMGPKIVYRLGESIEHQKVKKHVHPPANPARWAAACAGIVRHYNDGWAKGFHFGIDYWEIWNEPENRPAMWTGSDEQYLELYVTAAKSLKAAFPNIKVGGPALGYQGEFSEQGLKPSSFCEKFLDRIASDHAPLDFLSWHFYGNDPAVPATRARAVRAMLDQRGLRKTESHLNEWNYLPDNDWRPMMLEGQGPDRQRWFERQGGAEGAAYVAAVLSSLQDAPLDAANFYRVDTGGFGLFSPEGVEKRSYFAFKAFAQLRQQTPNRLKVNPAPHVFACAGMSAKESPGAIVQVLVAAPAGGMVRLKLDSLSPAAPREFEIFRIDATHQLDRTEHGALAAAEDPSVELKMDGPTVLLVKVILSKG